MQRILIVDDQGVTRLILDEFLRSLNLELQVEVFGSPLAALEWAARYSLDLAIVDYRMPSMDGIELTRRLRALPGNEGLPVAMITALEDADRMIRRRAAEAGVLDFFCKPIEPNEWRARFRNLLALSSRQDREAHELTEVLFRIQHNFFGRNPKRVAAVSGRVAAQLGLSSQECGLIERAAPLNDLGQVRVPDSLLSKQSKLQQDEWKAVRHHTLLGYQLLRDNQSAFLQMAASIALSHHERFDGKGYPHGFTQRDIPLEARIVSVADVVDALLSERPYRPAWQLDQVLGYVLAERGKRFDPDCVDAFLDCMDEAKAADPVPDFLLG